jgi:hypothetical protein
VLRLRSNSHNYLGLYTGQLDCYLSDAVQRAGHYGCDGDWAPLFLSIVEWTITSSDETKILQDRSRGGASSPTCIGVLNRKLPFGSLDAYPPGPTSCSLYG